ncbi:MAG: glycosyltransferase family 1 protein [Pseudomonadota bacterium]
MKIAIVTDAWLPQTNGVVTTLSRTSEALTRSGYTVRMFTPSPYRTIACPSYPEIQLALFAGRRLRRALDAFAPDSIHIATEGPPGLAARRYCIRRKLSFTSSYHTQFPAYVRQRYPIPERWTYWFVRWFHNAAAATLVPTPTVIKELQRNGLRNPVLWGRGVDTDLFKPLAVRTEQPKRPTYLYVGRVSVEKNIEAFAQMQVDARKLIVGDGPDLAQLKRRFPDCEFTGYKFGVELANIIAAADVFVFPSRTDTFGLVMLEAMACGVPVAAYPVAGPIDVVLDGVTGVLHESLELAAQRALAISRESCRRHALSRSWENCTQQFLSNLVRACDAHPLQHVQPTSTSPLAAINSLTQSEPR